MQYIVIGTNTDLIGIVVIIIKIKMMIIIIIIILLSIAHMLDYRLQTNLVNFTMGIIVSDAHTKLL